ncbi:O-antigen ligase family protein [Halalkalicoccus ordinarius]|uniref:O-antigen ligase family protein n=1 Tax=Halalkalicoccus ordinarius TaxID=3116651 RepID=UPI00300F2980
MESDDRVDSAGGAGLAIGVGLLAGFTLLVAVAPDTDVIRTSHLLAAYLSLVAIALVYYHSTAADGHWALFGLQLVLVFAIGWLVRALVRGGVASRFHEVLAVLVLTLLLILARGDLLRFGTHGAPYLLSFAALFGVFLFHSSQYAANSGLGLFPVFAGIILGLNLFVVPRYVSQDAVYWSISLIAAGVALLALSTVFVGDYSIGVFSVRTWTGTLAVGNVPLSRSIYANPNTFGLLMFPGVIASVAATHRTYERSRHRAFAVVPLLCFPLTVVGLALSGSRAAVLAAAVALGLYVASSRTHPRWIPLFIAGTIVTVGLFLGGIALGVLPIDPANRFTLWSAGFRAFLVEGSPLGQGLVETSQLIEPYLPASADAYSIHNSYLSIALRAGFIGGGAYLVLVVGPLLHSMIRPALVVRTLGMLAIASGFAVHQLFEAYTLYQFGPGSILGALAVGYVIESLTAPLPVADSDGSDSIEGADASSSDSTHTADDGNGPAADGSTTDTKSGAKPDSGAESNADTGDGTDDSSDDG